MSGTAHSFIVDLLSRKLGPDDKVLEIGCGGQAFRGAIPGRYHGLDLPDSPYVDRPLDFACSAEAIPANDATFDVVFGVAAFLVVPDAARAFRECHRVLRPGGVLLVCDYQKDVALRLGAADPLHRHAWSFPELAVLLREAGFTSIRDRSTAALGRGPRAAAARLRRHRTHWLVAEALRP